MTVPDLAKKPGFYWARHRSSASLRVVEIVQLPNGTSWVTHHGLLDEFTEHDEIVARLREQEPPASEPSPTESAQLLADAEALYLAYATSLHNDDIALFLADVGSKPRPFAHCSAAVVMAWIAVAREAQARRSVTP